MNYVFPDNCQIKGLNEIYLKYFGYKTEGTFVEVGAFDGVFVSNTWGLAEAGWTGFYIEPMVEYAQLCANNHVGHPNINTLNLCVGEKDNEEVDFYRAGTLSTFNKEHRNCEYWKGDYANSTSTKMKTITLDTLLMNIDVFSDFELLVVDTEGSETDVLKGFSLKHWLPKMCIVEVHELHESQELNKQAPWVNKYFADASYEKIYSDNINNIYWKV